MPTADSLPRAIRSGGATTPAACARCEPRTRSARSVRQKSRRPARFVITSRRESLTQRFEYCASLVIGIHVDLFLPLAEEYVRIHLDPQARRRHAQLVLQHVVIGALDEHHLEEDGTGLHCQQQEEDRPRDQPADLVRNLNAFHQAVEVPRLAQIALLLTFELCG